MTDHHLIIPPEELVDKWVDEYNRAKVKHHNLVIYIAGKASKWSADAELDACLNLLGLWGHDYLLQKLGETRRPGSPSLKEQALAALNVIEDKTLGPTTEEILIRRALEALPND